MAYIYFLGFGSLPNIVAITMPIIIVAAIYVKNVVFKDAKSI